MLDYVFEHHPSKRANEIALELLEFPNVLSNFPLLGKIESALADRSQNYRFISSCCLNELDFKIISVAPVVRLEN